MYCWAPAGQARMRTDAATVSETRSQSRGSGAWAFVGAESGVTIRWVREQVAASRAADRPNKDSGPAEDVERMPSYAWAGLRCRITARSTDRRVLLHTSRVPRLRCCVGSPPDNDLGRDGGLRLAQHAFGDTSLGSGSSMARLRFKLRLPRRILTTPVRITS